MRFVFSLLILAQILTAPAVAQQNRIDPVPIHATHFDPANLLARLAKSKAEEEQREAQRQKLMIARDKVFADLVTSGEWKRPGNSYVERRIHNNTITVRILFDEHLVRFSLGFAALPGNYEYVPVYTIEKILKYVNLVEEFDAAADAK